MNEIVIIIIIGFIIIFSYMCFTHFTPLKINTPRHVDKLHYD